MSAALLVANSSASVAIAGHDVRAVEELGAKTEDEVADLADGEVERIDGVVDPGAPPRRDRCAISERHVLERERDAVDRLDDAVVEVARDPLALLDDRQPLDLLVEPRVLDGDPGPQREHLDEEPVGRR